jgi:hypothetical protein
MSDSVELMAAGIVVALPFVVVGVSGWARDGPAGHSVPLPVWLVAAVALSSGAAAVIHLLVIEEHLAASRVTGLAFALLTAFQALWAVGYLAWPRAPLGWSAMIVNVGAIVVWAFSRSIGVPDWLSPEGIEAVGLPDAACAILEIGLVVGLLALHWRPMRERVTDGRALTRADAALGITMIGLAALLLTLGSIATLAGPAGHGHAGEEISPHEPAD